MRLVTCSSLSDARHSFGKKRRDVESTDAHRRMLSLQAYELHDLLCGYWLSRRCDNTHGDFLLLAKLTQVDMSGPKRKHAFESESRESSDPASPGCFAATGALS